MKPILQHAVMMLAALALAFPAAAQERKAAQPIVVTAKYKKDWEKGSKLERQGLKEMERAKAMLARYSAAVIEAQNKRDASRTGSEMASAEFRRLTGGPIFFSEPQDAVRWSRQVEKAAVEWARHEDRRGDGRAGLEKAVERQVRTQKLVDKAQAKIDEGREIQAEARRRSAVASD